eukprot:scaffold43905_cov28-Tisochrysis_lutea.AAC.1
MAQQLATHRINELTTGDSCLNEIVLHLPPRWWLLVSGGNGRCDWPALREVRTSTDILQYHPRGPLSCGRKQQRH